MKINILTIFPELYDSFLNSSLISKAIEKDLLEINIIDFREYSDNKHNKVDDILYGGGHGMLLMPQPIFDAIEQNKLEDTFTIHMSPRGHKLDSQKVLDFSKHKEITILASRYEGVDQRVIDTFVDEEISIGDYILMGGELPSQVLIESISRHISGVIGNENSQLFDSFSNGLLEEDNYTRPEDFRGLKVPDVLLSGHHKEIEKWKQENSLQKTKEIRPDFIKELNEKK
ncbi:MAG: tRNA (guanosine(37)-N1)-methyltransferase TrmD [Mycoplasmatales bacterium]